MGTTIRELLQAAAAEHGGKVALRFKRDKLWHELPYSGLARRAGAVSGVLRRLRVRPGDRVGIFMENAPEWPEIYLGVVCLGATAVPIDAKLHEQEAAHVLRDSGCTAAFVSGRCSVVLREVAGRLEGLRDVLVVGAPRPEPAAGERTRYHDYTTAVDDALAKNAGFPDDSPPPRETDVASILYTSGTTGRQKGAMLTHRNFCSNVQQCLDCLPVNTEDNFLLLLPLHHAFAFTASFLLPLAAGAEISFVESLKTVSENIREVSPTIVIGVPLLIERMYGRIRAGLAASQAASLLLALGLRRLVSRRIIRQLGGRLRYFVVGGAASSPEVMAGFARLGIPIIEGYGLTETGPVLTLNPPDRPRIGTVGRPVPDVQLEIYHPDAAGVGEIKARGPNIMAGYYHNPAATRDALRDGWFYTGDLGYIDADGYLTISGRSKNLIVNGAGKNIYPEEVESHIRDSCATVSEALVAAYTVPGETGERVGLIVVPNQEVLDAAAERARGALSDEAVRRLVLDDVRKACRNMAAYKRPSRIIIRQEAFEKTSTNKIKRYLYGMDGEGRG